MGEVEIIGIDVF